MRDFYFVVNSWVLTQTENDNALSLRGGTTWQSLGHDIL